jgi:hypothetical protein
MEMIEKSGLIKFTNKVFGKEGIYKSEIWFNSLKYEKTFFPSSWSREKVVTKIYEAYDNFIANGALTYELTRDGKYLIKTFTNEGIKIEMYMTKTGQITSAYPVF